jgi:hypothetical protein
MTEHVHEFLKPFVEGARGYIGLSKVNRAQDTPENNRKWSEFVNSYPEVTRSGVEIEDGYLESAPDWEWYFTPAILTTRNRLQSKFKQSNVVWIDFDTYVDWEAMDPAPSIVVATSEEKVHCYWLMDTPITDVNDMRYWCKRFLLHFDELGDKSGFDATQLLRVPYGKNLKLGARDEDGNPFSPRVLKFDPELRYNESSFADMPEPELDVAMVEVSEIPGIPKVTLSWEEYYEEYSEDIPDKMYRRLSKVQDGGEEKRSGALYSLICDLSEALGDAAKVFKVLYRSPNDKFTADHGPSRGATLLWKDVNRVHAKHAAKKATEDSIRLMSDLLESKVSLREKGVRVSEYVRKDLEANGHYLQSTEKEMYYVYTRDETPVLYPVSTEKTSELAGYLTHQYGLNAGVDSAVMSGVLHDILYECQRQTPVQFHDFTYYDIESNTVYVDRYDSTMYVLNGETIEHHPHGYNGVYFHATSDGLPKPFEYDPGYEPGGLTALVLDGPNYTVHGRGISLKQLHHILLTWVTSFFFPAKMRTKPIVLIHGEPDSGKTTMFQCLSAMLTGDSTIAVTEMPTDVKEFNVLVSQNPYIFLDNVNVNQKSMQEKLAQAATGYVAKNRTLHTNKEVTNLRARAFIGITSFTVDKIQKDVAQRYVILPVHPFAAERNHTRKALSVILEEIMVNRNFLWGELLDYVNKVVEHIGRHGLQSTGSQIRMADYAAFLQLTADMHGLNYIEMETFIRKMQAETIQENDPMFAAIRKYLGGGPDVNAKLTAKNLYETLCRMDRKFAGQYKTSGKFAHAFKAAVANDTFKFAGIGAEVIQYSKSAKYRVYPLQFDVPGQDSEEDEDE